MKTLALSILIITALTVNKSHAQENQIPGEPKQIQGEPGYLYRPTKAEIRNRVYDAVEQEPSFPGGQEKLDAFLAKNTKNPDAKDSITGSVYVMFIVEKNGKLSNIEAIRGPSVNTKIEAVKVVKHMPRWIPGMQDGKRVRVNYTIAVRFN